MQKPEKILAEIPTPERQIFLDFVSFPQYFSVDWLETYPPSKLMSVIMLMNKEGWIIPKPSHQGCYTWSTDFPRQEIIKMVDTEEMSQCFRRAVTVILKNMTTEEETILTIAHLSILAGMKEEDIDFIIQAAEIEEKNHRISSAVELYDSILQFMEIFITPETQIVSDSTWRIFINALERRAALSIFHPSLKKIHRFLSAALQTAQRLNDLRTQASLELLIGQNYWMYLQYENAVLHFDQGWEIIQRIEDEELYAQGLKVQGLAYVLKGQPHKAIEVYELSLGKLESTNENDFFLLVSLVLALAYTEAGMPQRGLGITETIEKHCLKTANLPLLSYTLITAGMIFLEICQKQESRDYFERALKIATKENIPFLEVLAGIGLSDIECQNGNFKLAGEHFKVISRLKKSNWFHILNFRPLFDTPYILYSKGVAPIELKPFFEFVRSRSEHDVNPLMYAMIQRLNLGLPEISLSIEEKIAILINLKKTVKQIGATMELAKVRIELAKLFDKAGNVKKSSDYAKDAWEFYSLVATDCFPMEIKHLVPRDIQGKEVRLFNLIVEMGDALTNHDNLERLLTNIITSLSRLMGSERSALFIKDRNTSDLRIAASRNLLPEETQEDSFRDTLSTIISVSKANDGEIVHYEKGTRNLSDYRRVIIAPLQLGKKNIGILYQDSRFFSFDVSQDNLQLLSALTSTIAISIDRAQAYDEIAQLNKILTKENLYYLEEIKELRPFGEIIGMSDAISILQSLVQKVAPTQSTVLILGETGVGKELIARAIHRESVRKDGPFIRVNCAALPDSLIDSELFGYEKGAFTGATKTKEGRFELANNGSIFLDEVSELPLPTQSRLLRILQEKEFQRVGGTKTLKSDFRLIAATNKDLKQEVAEGRFRADLFFRLSVFPIFVPPLRERTEDIPHLALYFLKLYCLQSNKDYSGIPESEMRKLQSYSWPGNIRELSNMVERAVILGGAKITFPDLASNIIKQATATHNEIKLYEVEKAHIVEILKKTNGKISGANGAAALLGLNRSTLIYRMKKLGIKMAHREIIS